MEPLQLADGSLRPAIVQTQFEQEDETERKGKDPEELGSSLALGTDLLLAPAELLEASVTVPPAPRHEHSREKLERKHRATLHHSALCAHGNEMPIATGPRHQPHHEDMACRQAGLDHKHQLRTPQVGEAASMPIHPGQAQVSMLFHPGPAPTPQPTQLSRFPAVLILLLLFHPPLAVFLIAVQGVLVH